MSADKKVQGGFDSDQMIPGPERIVPPPQGALEEAASLFDELIVLVSPRVWSEADNRTVALLADLERRRAALEPRLARRRENQAKARGGKP